MRFTENSRAGRECPKAITVSLGLACRASKIFTQLRQKDFDLRSVTTPGPRPLAYPSTPVFVRGSREPRQQVNVQVRYFVAPHRHVDMLSPCHFAQHPARPPAPQADRAGLIVGQISQSWCMP